MMLWQILDAHGGTLPDDIKVVFCNTGKERPETLDFVERCGQQWGIEIVWLEYRHDNGPTLAVVDYATASRNGEPLEAAITARSGDSGYLPNPLVRYCTIETKILTTIRYLKSLGWDHWTNAIGFRADEPARLAKLAAKVGRCQEEHAVAPLATTNYVNNAVSGLTTNLGFIDLSTNACTLIFTNGLLKGVTTP
jgi:3'-phosphoadenosine 5'-phosphosulfate sulfotransferase (PAPS reductase)/FAD synthetase